MSGMSMSHGGPTQSKQISSRLLNMKFMQRAAAADKVKAPASPHTPAPEPPLKRRRTTELQYDIESPSTPGTPFSASSRANSAVYRSEAEPITPASRAQNHFGNNTYETEWVLNVQLPGTRNPLSARSTHRFDESKLVEEYSDEDEDEDEDDIWNITQPSGRQTFGSFKKKKTTKSILSDETSTPAAQSKSARRNAKTLDHKHDQVRADTKPSRLSPGLDSDENSDTGADDSDQTSSSKSDTDSDANSDDESPDQQDHEDRINKRSKPPRQKPSIDFLSEEYNKKLDSMDFQSPGFTTGLGKQRFGLGGGGGGRSGTGQARNQGNTPKTRTHLGGQAIFENEKKKKSHKKKKAQREKTK